MKYQQEKFSVAVGTKEYRDNWDKIFGKKPPEPEGRVKDAPCWCEVDGRVCPWRRL